MKKVLIASILAATVTAASALEMGVTASRDYGTDRNSGGVTLSNSYGKIRATAGVERTSIGDVDQNRFSLVGSYDLVKVGPVTVGPRLGVAYLENQTGSDGYAATVGVGASIPVTKQVTLGIAVDRQYGQSRVKEYNSNRMTVGVNYSF